MLLRCHCALLLLSAPLAARAQTTPAPLPSFYTTYQYTGYTVYDNTTGEPPTEVRGVGGTLVLRSDGTYEKHLSIVAPSGPHYFNQTGRFVLAGDSIRFSFSDLKGADMQRGTFQFDPAARRLVLTIHGYPVGNKGVYALVAALPKPAPKPPAPAARPGRKRRR